MSRYANIILESDAARRRPTVSWSDWYWWHRVDPLRPEVRRLLERAESFTVSYAPDGRVERVRAEGQREDPPAARKGPGPWDVVLQPDGTYGIPAAARLREAHNGK